MDPSIKEQEQALFSEWKAHLQQASREEDSRLFPDGTAEGSLYWDTRPRVLFLLKEVNVRPEEKPWNLFEAVGDGSIGPTWTMLSYWLHGIHRGGPSWGDIRGASVESRREAISKMAVVNLNKCGGGAHSFDSQLWAAAYRDRHFLRRQLQLYAPHIIIACGVGDIAKSILFEEHWSGWTKTKSMHWLRPKALDTLLLWANHPQARRSHEDMYTEVVEALRELSVLPTSQPTRG